MTAFARTERVALCQTLVDVGPDAPTLCEGWLTRDLAAHLVVRETRPDAALGLLVPALSARGRRIQDEVAATPWTRLIARVRYRPWWTPLSWGRLDEGANLVELFVHHEDVLRAQATWTQPRHIESAHSEALWQAVTRRGRLLSRKSPVGIVARHPDGREASIRPAPNGAGAVVLTGEPGEIVLYLFGRRSAAQVDLDGPDDAVRAMQAVDFGV